MRPLTISAFWGGTGDTGVTPKTAQVTPRFSIYNKGLTCGVTGVAPKTNFLSEFINYREYSVFIRFICFSRNSVTRVTRTVKRLFLRTFWGDTRFPLVPPRRHQVTPRQINTLKSFIFTNTRGCHHYASR